MFKGNSFSDMWNVIIRPPRDEYMVSKLGPKEFKLNKKAYKREDLTLKNERGLLLECSHYKPVDPPCKQMPCVIYLHGNSSSRIEALSAVNVLLPANITLFCFDFAGCGKSEGEYISLGYYEKDDVKCVMKYLRDGGQVSTIGLWGRSMGAVTALMHADRDPSIAGIVLDSPFSNLRMLSEELVSKHASLPSFIVSGALAIIKTTIKSKAEFDIDDLQPINTVDKAYVPAYFVHATGDKFIDKHHTTDLHKQYGGEKKITYVEGDHNSARPQYFLDSVAIFFYNTLLVEQMVPFKEEKVSNDKSPKQSDINEASGFRDIYEEHSQNLMKSQNLNIGNGNDVQNMLSEFSDGDLERAIQESLKLAEQNGYSTDATTNSSDGSNNCQSIGKYTSNFQVKQQQQPKVDLANNRKGFQSSGYQMPKEEDDDVDLFEGEEF